MDSLLGDILYMPTALNQPIHAQRRPPSPTRVQFRADPISEPNDDGEPCRTVNGADLVVRPIRENDVSALMRAFKRMTPEQVRARTFHTLKELPEPIARAMCRVDPAKTAALVAVDAESGEIRGEARVYFDDVTESAELAVAVDPAFTGQGLGRAMLQRLIEICRQRGMREIWGDTQNDNKAMLDLAKSLGFARHVDPNDASLQRISLSL